MQQGVKTTVRRAAESQESRWTILRGSGPAKTSGSGESSVPDHRLDWLYAGNGLFREGESEGDSPEQFTFDIHRAAAHTLQNAGLSQRSTAETGDDDGLPWAEILEYAEDFDLEVFDAVSLEDGFSDASKTRADILNWEEVLTGGRAD